MSNYGRSSRKIDTVFIVALFTVFAATTLLVVLIAAKQYKLTARVIEDNYGNRTASSYLREIIHQNDTASSVELTTFSEIPAIAFHSTINDTPYVTYVYYYDGYIREIFANEGAIMIPDSGQFIVEANALSAEFVTDELLLITYEDTKGVSHDLYVSLHSDDAKEGL